MSDERPKRSWREIDQRKDRSSHRQDERKGSPARGQRSQKSYRAALDRLFDSGSIGKLVEDAPGEADSGGGGEHRLKLMRAIAAAEGRDAITAAVDAYVEKHALPQDIEVLTKVLEHRNDGRKLEALQLLLVATETEQPKRSRALVGQLKLIRDTADDPELEQLARQLLERVD